MEKITHIPTLFLYELQIRMNVISQVFWNLQGPEPSHLAGLFIYIDVLAFKEIENNRNLGDR